MTNIHYYFQIDIEYAMTANIEAIFNAKNFLGKFQSRYASRIFKYTNERKSDIFMKAVSLLEDGKLYCYYILASILRYSQKTPERYAFK